ncbi:MAG: hypothetical protein PHY08_10865, partial [Candidatus Cloacimonetes bacterium]|nr:hypothetical protein [Candidatus Cloacimonadota bacterium]
NKLNIREIDMSKNHRGKGLKNVPAQGRGTCPICHRTGIKVVYETKVNEETLKTCKECFKTVQNKG